MNVPTWVTIVGVFMILLGGCGACSNVSKINRPADLESSSDIMEEVMNEIKNAEYTDKDVSAIDSGFVNKESVFDSLRIETEGMDSAQLAKIDEFMDGMGDMLIFSDYYKKWIKRLGIIGLIVSIFYSISGLLMVIGKPMALKLTYAALAISCAFLIFQIVIMSMDNESGFFGKMSTSIGSYSMLFINVVLIIIVAASNKEYFYQHEKIEE